MIDPGSGDSLDQFGRIELGIPEHDNLITTVSTTSSDRAHRGTKELVWAGWNRLVAVGFVHCDPDRRLDDHEITSTRTTLDPDRSACDPLPDRFREIRDGGFLGVTENDRDLRPDEPVDTDHSELVLDHGSDTISDMSNRRIAGKVTNPFVYPANLIHPDEQEGDFVSNGTDLIR